MLTGKLRWVVLAAVMAVGAAGTLASNAGYGRGVWVWQALLEFGIAGAFLWGLSVLLSRSETASLRLGLPLDERWESISNRALALAARFIVVVLVAAIVAIPIAGGDAAPYALVGAAFASAYLGGIVWYHWRQ